VLWRSSITSYRNYSATIALTEPSEYGGGDLEFFAKWGDKDSCVVHRPELGSGIAFCGCQENINAVTGVKWGFRLVLLIWTRPAGVDVASEQAHVCYYRPGTGSSVWLTSADLQEYPKRIQRSDDSIPAVGNSDNAEAEKTKENFNEVEEKKISSLVALPPTPPAPVRPHLVDR